MKLPSRNSERTTHILGLVSGVSPGIIRCPRCPPSGSSTRPGLPADRTICAKPKGERSIWQSTKICPWESDRKGDGADHVAHYRARRYLGGSSLWQSLGRRDLSS